MLPGDYQLATLMTVALSPPDMTAIHILDETREDHHQSETIVAFLETIISAKSDYQ